MPAKKKKPQAKPKEHVDKHADAPKGPKKRK